MQSFSDRTGFAHGLFFTMAKPLTQRALRIFAVLESYRAGSFDILDALLPFFEPILAEVPGQTLNATEFAARVSETYRWNFTADIVEELIPRFEAKGWLKKITGTAAAYRIIYDNPLAAPSIAQGDIQITQTLATLAEEFAEFVRNISPLTTFAIDNNNLGDILVEWLISIDAYTEDVLRQKALQVTKTEGQIGLAVVVNDSSNLSSEEKYLCARFVKHLFDRKSPFVTDLCKLASIGLLTEVVQDFHKPTTQVSKTNLIVYLDAPVAMDLLGVSGKEAAANIRPIIQKLQDIGGTVRIFRASIDELQGALDAVLRRNPTERTGPTAGALRRNEVMEAFVRQVAHDPATFLTEYQVAIVDRKLNQFPNEHEFFDQQTYDEFFSKLVWHIEIPRREHDATVVASVMRMRRGTQSRDLFATRHILITRNALLCESAKQFCINRGLNARTSVGPAIHQRQLATATWLRTGLSDIQQDVPRRYLLAACERVLELKKSVVDQVRIISRSLTTEKAQQLDLLLTQDRSTQLLMDKTLGSSNVVNAHNIEPLIEDMRRTLTETIETEAAATIATAQRDAAARVRKANERRKLMEQENAALLSSLAQSEGDDALIIDALLAEVNREMSRRRQQTRWVVGGIIFLVGVLPLLTDRVSNASKIACLVAAGIIGAVFATLQIFDVPVGIEGRIIRWGQSRFNRLAELRGIRSKLDKYPIEQSGLVLRRSRPLTLD